MQWISKWLFFSRRNLNGKLQSPPYLMVLMVFTTGGERFYLDKSKCQPSMEHLMFVSLIKEGFFSDTWWSVWKKIVGLCEAADKIPLFVYLIACLSWYSHSPFSMVCLKLCPWGHTKRPPVIWHGFPYGSASEESSVCSVPLKALFHTLSLPRRSPGLISTAEQPREGREAKEAARGLGAPAALDTHTARGVRDAAAGSS